MSDSTKITWAFMIAIFLCVVLVSLWRTHNAQLEVKDLRQQLKESISIESCDASIVLIDGAMRRCLDMHDSHNKDLEDLDQELKVALDAGTEPEPELPEFEKVDLAPGYCLHAYIANFQNSAMDRAEFEFGTCAEGSMGPLCKVRCEDITPLGRRLVIRHGPHIGGQF